MERAKVACLALQIVTKYFDVTSGLPGRPGRRGK
jgi:hypothetical protein